MTAPCRAHRSQDERPKHHPPDARLQTIQRHAAQLLLLRRPLPRQAERSRTLRGRGNTSTNAAVQLLQHCERAASMRRQRASQPRYWQLGSRCHQLHRQPQRRVAAGAQGGADSCKAAASTQKHVRNHSTQTSAQGTHRACSSSRRAKASARAPLLSSSRCHQACANAARRGHASAHAGAGSGARLDAATCMPSAPPLRTHRNNFLAAELCGKSTHSSGRGKPARAAARTSAAASSSLPGYTCSAAGAPGRSAAASASNSAPQRASASLPLSAVASHCSAETDTCAPQTRCEALFLRRVCVHDGAPRRPGSRAAAAGRRRGR